MVTGGVLIALIFLMALGSALLTSTDPNAMNLPAQFQAPSWAHPLGLDQNGRDVWSRIVYGARVSLIVAFSVVLISSTIGLIIGSISGYVGKTVDLVIMRFLDMLYAFPGFLLALGIVAVLGPSLTNLVFAMCVTGWAGYARLVRGEVLHIKEKDFVQSALAMGANPVRIISLHIWPNLLSPLLIQASFGLAGTIIAESSLSFLGLGAPPEVPTWGSMLNSGREYLFEYPHLSLAPGVFIVLLVLGFNLFGDGLRDYLDPKSD